MNPLWNVPAEILTPEICMTAVRKDGRELEHVPECMQTSELIEAAINQTDSAIFFVKNNATRMAYLLKHDVISKGDPTPILESNHTSFCDYYRKNSYTWKGCNCASQDNIQPLYSGAKPEYADVFVDDKDFTTSNDKTIRLDNERQEEINKMRYIAQ
jgi:hypothetical protein